MSYSTFQLNQRINNLQQQINNGGVGAQTLAQVLNTGNIASKDINMNTNDITGASQINATTLDTSNLSVDTITSNVSFTGGVATFTSIPQCSVVPTTDTDLVNKKYVDDNIPVPTLQEVLNSGSLSVNQEITLANSVGNSLNIISTRFDFTKGSDYGQIEYKDTADLHLTSTGTITLTGTTTFEDIPQCSIVPTTDTDITNKKYVDDVKDTVDLQTVLDNGSSANLQTIELTNDALSSVVLNTSTLNFVDTVSNADITYTNDYLYFNATNINLNGQSTFDVPPHSTTPILGNDLTTKDYVDGLVGQYSGGYNLFLNYSESLTVNSITYKYLSNEVSSAIQQDVITITDGTDQLIASFITDEINILEIPSGLWSLTLYGSVSGAGGILYYYFKIKKYSGGIITDLITSGNSPDVNATPTGNPDAYHMNATIPTAISVLLTDRIIIEIYCIKVSGTSINLNTYFESSYYSFIQTTLNAGTTLLTSSNNWTGNNAFQLIPTTLTATANSNNTQLTTTAYIYNELLSYLTTATASSTYATISSLASYLTTAIAAATYLPITTASTTYAPIISPSFSTGATVGSGSLTITSGDLTLTNATNLIKAGLVGPATNGVSFGLASTQTTGILNIGTGARTTLGTINIGTGAGLVVNPINIGGAGSAITLNGTVAASTYNGASGGATTLLIGDTQTTGDIRIGTQQTSGDIWIGQNSGRNASGQILIGSIDTASAIVPIVIGNINSTTTLNGTVSITNSPTAPTPTAGDSSTKLSTTAFISNALLSYLTTAIASATYAPLANPTFTTAITLTSGNITASSGNIIGTLLRNGSNTGSISSTGVINASALTSPSLTTATATTLALGTSTATAITIGATGITTTINGTLTTSTISNSSALSITATGNTILRADGSGTVVVSSAGAATFGSWNGNDTNIGTNSFANVIIAATGTGALARTTTINGETVSISSSTGATTIKGSLTLEKPIILPTTATTIASTQLGYFVEYTNGHVTISTVSSNLATTGATIAIGRYLVIVTWMCDTFSIATNLVTLTLTATNGTSNILLGAFGASTGTGGAVNGSVSGYASITTTSGTLALTGLTSAGTVSCKTNIKLIRLG